MNKQKMMTCTRALAILGIFLLLLSCVQKQPQPYKNFAEASTKLNTPAKIDDFQKKHFEWASTSQGGGCAGIDIGINLEACPPDFIFNNKGRGNCGAFTTFAVDCLRKAGYEAYPLSIYKKWPDSLAPGHQPRDYHIMTLYKENGKWYTMDNGKTKPEGIKGPFNSIEDLPYKVLKILRN